MTSVQFLFATANGRIFVENASVLRKAGDHVIVNQLLDAGAAKPEEGVTS